MKKESIFATGPPTQLDMSVFDGTRVLITGGAGFVGSNLVRKLLADSRKVEIVVVDNFLSSERENLPIDPRISVVVGSIADTRLLHELPREIDFVFHLACYHGNQSSIHDPIADHANNLLTSLQLFDFLAKNRAPRKVVYAAAGCAVAEKTFDEPSETLEDAPISAFHDSPYSISKVVGELYGNYYFTSSGLPFVKTRFQNVYGPGELLGAGLWRGTANTVWRNVVPTFIWKAMVGDALVLENNGQSSRDFIFVGDLVEGLLRASVFGTSGEAYNLGSGHETIIRDLAQLIVSVVGTDSDLVFQGKRVWDSSGRRLASTLKSEREIGFRASTSLSIGIRQTVDWMLENQSRIAASIEKHRGFL